MNVSWEANVLHRSSSFDSIPEYFNTPAGMQLTRSSRHQNALGKTRRRSESSPPALGRPQANFTLFPLLPTEIRELIYLAVLEMEGGRVVNAVEQSLDLIIPSRTPRPPKEIIQYVIGQKLPNIIASHREVKAFLLKTGVYKYLFAISYLSIPPVLYNVKRDSLFLTTLSGARHVLGNCLKDPNDLSFVKTLRLKTPPHEHYRGWMETNLEYFPNLEKLTIELTPRFRRQREGVTIEVSLNEWLVTRM
jgi:hypothetical protein